MGRVEGEDGLKVLADVGVNRLPKSCKSIEGGLCPDGVIYVVGGGGSSGGGGGWCWC